MFILESIIVNKYLQTGYLLCNQHMFNQDEIAASNFTSNIIFEHCLSFISSADITLPNNDIIRYTYCIVENGIPVDILMLLDAQYTLWLRDKNLLS